jgi:hypothetical protein
MTLPQSAYIRGIVGGNRPLLLLKPRFQVRHVSHRMPKAMLACILKASVYAHTDGLIPSLLILQAYKRIPAGVRGVRESTPACMLKDGYLHT